MDLNKAFAVVCASLVLAACGGGGGGGSSSSPAAAAPTTTTTTAVPAPAACSATVTSGATNEQSICVSGGPTGSFTNVVLTSVKVCSPGSTTNCLTIPNVQVDTGSSGLRLFNSQISGLSLPSVPVGNGDNYYECGAFADGVVWGTMAKADITVAGETASAAPIQVILDNVTTPAVPPDCSNQGANENTPTMIGANGIIGVGLFPQDCGAACVTVASFTSTNGAIAQYFDCAGASCIPAVIPLASQVVNPVSAFAADNNGVILQIPAIPDTGYANVGGNIIFGINTEANNQLGSAPVVTVFGSTSQTGQPGTFSLVYNNQTYSESFIDSGSSAYFFNAAGIPACSSTGVAEFYSCPGSTTSLSLETPTVTITSASNATATAVVKFANAQFLFTQGSAATLFDFDDIAAPAGTTLPNAFDMGVPFLYGRSVYSGIESATAAPYFAWTAYTP